MQRVLPTLLRPLPTAGRPTQLQRSLRLPSHVRHAHTSLSFTRSVWQEFIKNEGHDANAFGHMKVVEASPGRVVGEMVVEKHQVNRLGSLHGGCTSSLIDTLGSLSLSTKGLWFTGVSTDIHVTFVKAAMLGDKVKLVAEVVGQGKTLAYTRVEMTSAATGKLLAYGSHTKYIASALKAPENIKIDEAGNEIEAVKE